MFIDTHRNTNIILDILGTDRAFIFGKVVYLCKALYW